MPRLIGPAESLLQLKKAQAEAADATTQLVAAEQALKTLEAGDMDAIKHQYVDAVRKMAVTQVRPTYFVGVTYSRLCHAVHRLQGRLFLAQKW
jgi:thiamine pyrophosphokinase